MGKGYFVDCEYNKVDDGLGGDTTKKLTGYDKDWVYPDIIIHDRKREVAGNLAVIEAKWSGSDRSIELDKVKIGLYLTQPELKYKFGFLIVLKRDSINVEPVRKASLPRV